MHIVQRGWNKTHFNTQHDCAGNTGGSSCGVLAHSFEDNHGGALCVRGIRGILARAHIHEPPDVQQAVAALGNCLMLVGIPALHDRMYLRSTRGLIVFLLIS